VVAVALEKCDKADGRTISKIVSEIQDLVGVEELPTVLRAARDKRAGVRAGAVGLFWRYKKQAANQGEQVVPVLLERLRDEDAEVRWWAANTAHLFPEQAKQVVPALIKVLDDKAVLKTNGSVASTGASALGCLGAAARPALIKKTRSALRDLREQSFYALGRIGLRDPLSRAKVLEAIKERLHEKQSLPDRAVAASAASLLGPQAKPVLEDLRRAFRATDIADAKLAEDTQGCVLSAFQEMGPGAAAALPDIIAVFEDRKQPHSVRDQAIKVLESIGYEAKRAIPALSSVANSRLEKPGLRLVAANTLEKLRAAVKRVESPCPSAPAD
jgi:HEAT repeat protein